MVSVSDYVNTQFSWTKFYMEFGDKLLEHKDDRRELVAKVREACLSVGFRYLENIPNASGGTGLQDICPFTVMGTFNRGKGIESANCRTVALELGNFLGVSEPVPFVNDGSIPTLAATLGVFFWEPDGVDPLWEVFEAALQFADSNSDSARQAFVHCYDRALGTKGVGVNLSMGLYWILPHRYPSLDSKSRKYISDHLSISLPQIPPSGDGYLAFADDLIKRFQSRDFPIHSFPDLAVAAYRGAPPPPPPPPCGYSIDSIVDQGCFLPQPTLESMLHRLQTKQNLILQGPPGTGKTWLAKRLAYALIGRKDETKVRPMQFHPNLSYEDFVRGWRPQGDGSLSLVDGPFLQIVERAGTDEDNDYVMVIEEINRGNPASIFGEMLTLLEADKRSLDESLALAYPREPDERVYIPPNVYVIGTMNTADRSIAMVDLALRRRFAFFDLEPMLNDAWRGWVQKQFSIDGAFLDSIAQRINLLNDEIASDRNLGRQFRIGHSFVTPAPGEPIEDPDEWFEQIVETEIVPQLHEYWLDDPDRVYAARSKLLGNA